MATDELHVTGEQVVQPAGPIDRRRIARRWAVLAAAVGGLLVLLWWVDPRQVPLPLCTLHRATGLYCPGCGATRATHDLLHGRLIWALQDNALWVLSIPLVLYAAASETARLLRGRALPGDLARSRRLLTAIVVAAAIFGVLRNIPSPPFDLLTPV